MVTPQHQVDGGRTTAANNSNGGDVVGSPPASTTKPLMMTFGKVHPTRQEYVCHIQNHYHLLDEISMVSSSQSTSISSSSTMTYPTPENIMSWFGCGVMTNSDCNDEKIVVYAPQEIAASGSTMTPSPLTYGRLKDEIRQFVPYKVLPPPTTTTIPSSSGTSSSSSYSVVALLLPSCFMAEMAVCLTTLLAQYENIKTGSCKICVAPIDPTQPTRKIVQAMKQMDCSGLVTTTEFYNELLRFEEEEEEKNSSSTNHYSNDDGDNFDMNQLFADIRIVRSKSKSISNQGVETITSPTSAPSLPEQPTTSRPVVGIVEYEIIKHEPMRVAKHNATTRGRHGNNDGIDRMEEGKIEEVDEEEERDDESPPMLLLRTSGTTSVPKLVPLTPSSLLYNAICIATSLQLHEGDIGCNVMPLYHIGGISCGLLSVLVSGTSCIMVPGPFDSNRFVDILLNDNKESTDNKNTGDSKSNLITTPNPTWYYGVPSMHKAIVLTAKAAKSKWERLQNNKLRFIRSGAAHLSHATAVDLASVFPGTEIYPTYSMTECMPVASCHRYPVRVQYQTGKELDRIDMNDEGNRGSGIPTMNEDTVGEAIGCSLAIIGDDGNILPHGETGQVCLRGPGVINGYVGIARSESHIVTIDEGTRTAMSWFQTGDMGQLDPMGRLTLVGRSKEMIKRGGDQVWPNEVDDLIERTFVDEIQVAVTFGVPNELWGEEVQVAVVLREGYQDTDLSALVGRIVSVCRDALGDAAAPTQALFVKSTGNLLRGSTGKYLRNKMAEHLGAKPLDTTALNALQNMAKASKVKDVPDSWTKPSDALNGVRFLTACFVAHIHIGLMPNLTWIKIQSFSFNMTIFFLLGALQLTTSVKSEVQSNAVKFIGTKIGSMHALFLVSQVISLFSYLLFQCGDNGYTQVFEDRTCVSALEEWLPAYVINTFTGMLGGFDPTNGPAWFQSAFYTFLIVFPSLDAHLRSKRGTRYYIWVFVVNLILASIGLLILSAIGLEFFNFRFVTWMPALVSAMIAGYWFAEYASIDGGETAEYEMSNRKKTCLQRPVVWGLIADTISLIFLLLEIAVARSPNCAAINVDFLEDISLGENTLVRNDTFEIANSTYTVVCGITYDEFVEFVHNDEDSVNYGRMGSDFGGILGSGRLGTPLVLLWLFALAYGRGLTAKLLGSQVMQYLAPYAYPLYLFHLPISRIYWVATRGRHAEFWWPNAAGFPVVSEWQSFVLVKFEFGGANMRYFVKPVAWYELLFIIVICVVLAMVLDQLIIQWLSMYTIKAGIWIIRLFARCCCCCCCREALKTSAVDNDPAEHSTLQRVQTLIKDLTGGKQFVDGSTNLRDIGLDSLGASALLGTLRASLPSARGLTLGQLATCETVDDLVAILTTNEAVNGPVERSSDDSRA